MSLTDLTVAYVADLTRRETGMLYGRGKDYLIEARLLPLARAAGCADVDDYVARLREDPAERAMALDALTINETSWFRDQLPFDALSKAIVPALVTSREERHLRVWSAACSSGQEPYSIAMVLQDHLPSGWTAEIWATDVSSAMVQRVREGRYSQVEMNRGLPASLLVRHFRRSGAGWEVTERLRRMVRPQQLNLVGTLPALPTFDVVFLRNVLIYFDDATRQRVLGRVRDVIAPDGYLVLGGTETTMETGSRWRRDLADDTPVHRPAPLTADPVGRTAVLRGA